MQPRHLLPLARNQLGVIRKAPGKDIHQGDPPMVRREKELSTKGHEDSRRATKGLEKAQEGSDKAHYRDNLHGYTGYTGFGFRSLVSCNPGHPQTCTGSSAEPASRAATSRPVHPCASCAFDVNCEGIFDLRRRAGAPHRISLRLPARLLRLPLQGGASPGSAGVPPAS